MVIPAGIMKSKVSLFSCFFLLFSRSLLAGGESCATDGGGCIPGWLVVTMSLAGLSAMGLVPPPANQINGNYLFSTYQEANWADYRERNPYTPASNLPWLFGSFEVPVFVSARPGSALLMEYSTVCINYGFLGCAQPSWSLHSIRGTITQVSYHLFSVTPVFVRVKIKFYGEPEMK